MSTEVVVTRKRLGLTRQEFADKLGVVRTTVMRWEKGAATPGEPALRLMRELAAQDARRREAVPEDIQ